MIDAPALAHAYRWLVIWFGIQLAAGIGRVFLIAAFADSPGGAGLLAVFVPAAILVTLGGMAYYAFRTAQALGSRVPFLWGFALVIPLLNVLSLIALSMKATRACRANGIAVGLLGPKLAG